MDPIYSISVSIDAPVDAPWTYMIEKSNGVPSSTIVVATADSGTSSIAEARDCNLRVLYWLSEADSISFNVKLTTKEPRTMINEEFDDVLVLALLSVTVARQKSRKAKGKE